MKRVTLAHGGGGSASRELIASEILPRFGAGPLAGLPDAARLPALDGPIVFSTDSFVVQPLEFPGGTIGDLAVHGTVNDVAVAGGHPRWLSLALVLEEGLGFDVLGRVLDSVAAAARDCGVAVVTGDTKVVARGQCDGMYVNTAGLGVASTHLKLDRARIRVGDRVVVSGPLGDHGMAVLWAREGFADGATGGSQPRSDTGPVHRLVADAEAFGPAIRFFRDPTRGGLAAVVNEVAEGRPFGVELDEAALPLASATRSVAELLGFDLLQVACEGRVVAFCAAEVADDLVAAWRAREEGRGAVIIGAVSGETPGRVVLRTRMGGRRLVDVPRGELLPRIC